jgi:hypothetical protein
MGYLKFGGFKAKGYNYKDDVLKTNLATYEFDIFGMGEMNLD